MYTLGWLTYCFVIGLCLPLLVHGDTKNCDILKIAQGHSSNDKMRVHCDTDDTCSGLHCQGVYLKDLNVKNADPVCFGVMINHCDDPLSMDIYVQNKAMNFSFQKRLHGNISIRIPDTSFPQKIYKDTFVFVELLRKNDRVTIAVTLKVRLRFGKIVKWPSTLEYSIIPEQSFAVPPCDAGMNKTVTPPPALKPCHPPLDVHTTPSVTTTIMPMSDTYHKPCDPKKLYTCHEKETCSFERLCNCQPQFVLNPYSGLCDQPGAHPKIVPNTASRKISPVKPAATSGKNTVNSNTNSLSENDHSSNKKTGLITGLAVGAAALLGSVILVAFLIWRWRSNQHPHVPLINNEEAVI